jgi:hypothetical protein
MNSSIHCVRALSLSRGGLSKEEITTGDSGSSCPRLSKDNITKGDWVFSFIVPIFGKEVRYV